MIFLIRIPAIAILIFFIFSAHIQARASTVEYDLTISREEMNITGKPVRGITINRSIPGPTLYFKEGDLARIHVHNKMKVETSIHWHGILVPPDMDGVPYISFPPIRPNATFTYEFPIRQSGTYWYHSHTGLQEQSGVYGSIVIEPRRNVPKFDHDYVVLFSDWTDEDPHEVNRTLKRGSEWYSIEKGSAQSIFGAVRLRMLGDYFGRELRRMPAMDIADVAYDRFLANGKPEWVLPAGSDKTVRLRIIDGSSTTYFHLEFAGGPMTIVAADGQDVEPVKEKRFLVGVAETYDVLVQIPSSGAYEFRATAHDGSGYASVWIGSGERHPAPEVPKPNLYHTMGDLRIKQIFSLTPGGAMGMPDGDVEAGKFDRPGMMHMGPIDMHAMKGMESTSNDAGFPEIKMDGMHPASNEGVGHSSHPGRPVEHPSFPVEDTAHSNHVMPIPPPDSRIDKKYGSNFGFLAADVSASENLAINGMDPRRPSTPYEKLRAERTTAFSREKPVRDIRLTLDGDMERYVWFINNRPLSESDSIRIREGEVVRFIMINRTMMHHPMHLHGHFFRVINSQGDYAPLKHTVDVAPMSTTVIEFETDEFGDWFFHCHLLYHMKAGMARLVHYEGYTLDPQLAAIRPELYKDSWYFWGRADAFTNMTAGFLTLSSIRNTFTAEWEGGWQNVDDTEWEILATWNRYINRFFTVFAGADLFGIHNDLDKIRAVSGIRYLLPLNLESRAWIDSDGGARFSFGKSFELTPRLSLQGEARYDTHDDWEGGVGISFMVRKSLSLVGQWHSDYGFGAGLRIRF